MFFIHITPFFLFIKILPVTLSTSPVLRIFLYYSSFPPSTFRFLSYLYSFPALLFKILICFCVNYCCSISIEIFFCFTFVFHLFVSFFFFTLKYSGIIIFFFQLFSHFPFFIHFLKISFILQQCLGDFFYFLLSLFFSFHLCRWEFEIC